MKRVGLAIVCLAGCGTLLSRNIQTVHVVAKPGTPIVVDGAPAGYAPTDVVVSNHRDHVIVAGDQSCRLTASVSGLWVVLDLLFLGGGWALDAVSGEWKELDTAECRFPQVAPHRPRSLEAAPAESDDDADEDGAGGASKSGRAASPGDDSGDERPQKENQARFCFDKVPKSGGDRVSDCFDTMESCNHHAGGLGMLWVQVSDCEARHSSPAGAD